MDNSNKKWFILILAFVIALTITITVSAKASKLYASDNEEWYTITEEEPIIEEIPFSEEIIDINYSEGQTSTSFAEEVIYIEEIPQSLTVTIYYSYMENPHYGMEVSILSTIEGDTTNCSYIWYYSADDGMTWCEIPNANLPTYTFILDKINADYMWRLRVKN